MPEEEADPGRDEAGQPETEGGEGAKTDMGQLRAGGLCEDIDLQEGEPPSRHEGSTGCVPELLPDAEEGVQKAVLQPLLDRQYRMHSEGSVAHPLHLQPYRRRRGHHQGPLEAARSGRRPGAGRPRREGHRGVLYQIARLNRRNRPQGGRVKVFAFTQPHEARGEENGDLRMEALRQSKNSKGILFGQVYVRRGSQRGGIQIQELHFEAAHTEAAEQEGR